MRVVGRHGFPAALASRTVTLIESPAAIVVFAEIMVIYVVA